MSAAEYFCKILPARPESNFYRNSDVLTDEKKCLKNSSIGQNENCLRKKSRKTIIV